MFLNVPSVKRYFFNINLGGDAKYYLLQRTGDYASFFNQKGLSSKESRVTYKDSDIFFTLPGGQLSKNTTEDLLVHKLQGILPTADTQLLKNVFNDKSLQKIVVLKGSENVLVFNIPMDVLKIITTFLPINKAVRIITNVSFLCYPVSTEGLIGYNLEDKSPYRWFSVMDLKSNAKYSVVSYINNLLCI